MTTTTNVTNTTNRTLLKLIAVIAVLLVSLYAYILANRPFLEEVWATYTNSKAGPKVSDNFMVLELSKLLPLKEAIISVDDASFSFGKSEIERSDIEKQISTALDVKSVKPESTTYSAPEIHLTFAQRSASPFCAGTFVWTKLTVANQKIVYSSERGGIYKDTEHKTVADAIDKSIRRLQSTLGSLEYRQGSLKPEEQNAIKKMYECPQKAIEGRQAPVQAKPHKDK